MDKYTDKPNPNIEKAFEILTLKLVELKYISKNHKELINELRSSLTKEELLTFEDITIRHSLHTLITISSLDLLAVLRLYKSSTLSWEKIFILKKGYLTIYETILAYEKKKKKIIELIVEFCEEAKNLKFDNINCDIKEFKKTYNFAKIIKIRNKVSGHIDEDFDEYYDTVMSIDPTITIQAIQQLLTILNKCDKFLSELGELINRKKEMEIQKVQDDLKAKKK